MGQVIVYSAGTRTEMQKICDKMKIVREELLAGWPYGHVTMQNVWDILAVYHELGLHQFPLDSNEKRRWYIAGNIVARIERDNRER